MATGDQREVLLDVEQVEGRNSRFNYRPPAKRPYPGPLACIRRHLFVSFLVVVFVGTLILL